MKTNKMMRIASVLLVAVILTTCAISGTFAKYVTTAEANDSARVAKWGVNVVATGDKAFAKTYASDTTGYEAATVIADVDVVAPGTTGNLAGVTVSGTPEVAVRVSYVAKLDLGDNWVADGAYYCPLEITVDTTTLYGKNYATVDEFEVAVVEAIEAHTVDFAANTAITTENTNITWNWAYEGNDDAKDTILGNAANATIDLEMTVTATQIN